MTGPSLARQTAVVAAVALAAGSVATTAALVAQGRGKGADYPFRDVAALAEDGRIGTLAGAVSVLGIMLWAAAAAAALLGGLLLRDADRPGQGAALLGFAALSAVGAIDDAFQVHEGLLPRIGLSQVVYPVLYGAAVGLLLIAGRRTWMAAAPLVLAAALLFLGGSIAVDEVYDLVGEGLGAGEVAIEDGLKFIGIALWATFAVWSPRILVRESPTDGASRDAR